MTQQSTAADERAIARLFALTDAVFAIAMTLLAIDLKVPGADDGATLSGDALVRALRDEWPSYLAFALSFYLIANYWRRHHREMRDVTTCTPAMVRRTIQLLFTITAMPFAAALLGQHGGTGGIAVAVYCAVNAAALLAQLSVGREARRLTPEADRTGSSTTELVADLLAYAVAAPAAYIFDGHGVVALVICVAVAGRASSVIHWRHERRAKPEGWNENAPLSS